MAGLGVAYRSQARDTKSEILDGAAAFGYMLGGMAMILFAHAIVEGFDGNTAK